MRLTSETWTTTSTTNSFQNTKQCEIRRNGSNLSNKFCQVLLCFKRAKTLNTFFQILYIFYDFANLKDWPLRPDLLSFNFYVQMYSCTAQVRWRFSIYFCDIFCCEFGWNILVNLWWWLNCDVYLWFICYDKNSGTLCTNYLKKHCILKLIFSFKWFKRCFENWFYVS